MLWRRSGALSPDVECPGKKSAHRTARQIIEKNRFRLMRKTPCGRASPVRSFRRGGKAKAQKAICIPRVDRHPESRGGPAFPRARRRAGDEPGTGHRPCSAFLLRQRISIKAKLLTKTEERCRGAGGGRPSSAPEASAGDWRFRLKAACGSPRWHPLCIIPLGGEDPGQPP